MCINESTQIRAVEPPCGGKVWTEDGVADALPKRATEPLCKGHGKSHLPAMQQIAVEIWSHRPLQQIFAALAAELQLGRQRRHPLDERVVHQRLSYFE